MIWEEIFVCTQHLHVTYSDVLMMPTAERRFYLGLLVKNKHREKEMSEEQGRKTGKGKKQRTISGEALKSAIKSGEVPLQ